MKQLVLFFVAIFTLAFTSTEANAQLFGRIFRAQPAVTYSLPAVTYGYQPTVTYGQPTVTYGHQPVVPSYSPIKTQSYSPAPVANRMPQPISGYGSNLHRNYMVRRAQKKWAETGVQPQNTANIRWAR